LEKQVYVSVNRGAKIAAQEALFHLKVNSERRSSFQVSPLHVQREGQGFAAPLNGLVIFAHDILITSYNVIVAVYGSLVHIGIIERQSINRS
jgi:hypothetical protein